VSGRWLCVCRELRDKQKREEKERRMGKGSGKEGNIRKSRTRDVDGTGK